MKKILLLMLFLPFLSGCMAEGWELFSPNYKYDVVVKSTSGKEIYVEGFYICGGDSWKAPVGCLRKQYEANSGPYFHPPYNSIEMKWKNPETNEVASAVANIKLPKDFTDVKGGEIILTIDPEKKKVDVSYRLRNLKTFELYDVDSDGNPIERPKDTVKSKRKGDTTEEK